MSPEERANRLFDGEPHFNCPGAPECLECSFVAEFRSTRAEAFREAAEVVPSNWLDPLLSGPDAVIGNPPYDCRDVERLLQAISAALRQRAEAEEKG